MNNVPSNQAKPWCRCVFETALCEELHAETDSQGGAPIHHQINNLVTKSRKGEVAHPKVERSNARKDDVRVPAQLFWIRDKVSVDILAREGSEDIQNVSSAIVDHCY